MLTEKNKPGVFDCNFARCEIHDVFIQRSAGGADFCEECGCCPSCFQPFTTYTGSRCSCSVDSAVKYELDLIDEDLHFGEEPYDWTPESDDCCDPWLLY